MEIEQPVSSCCGAAIQDTDCDLCPECKEHCEFEEGAEDKKEARGEWLMECERNGD